MSLTITFAENSLDQKSWKTFENYDNLCDFLVKEVKPKYPVWPQSGKIYHEFITKDHDITPITAAGAEALAKVKGHVFIVIWPAAQAIAVQAAVHVGMLILSTVIKKVLDTPDEKVTSRNIPSGSPNNLPGQRKNTARVLQRIPDIYGQVKCTPDLIQYPYISYSNNLQCETIVACIGRGEYFVDEDQIFEGSTRAKQIPGLSLAIYAPFTVPIEDEPQLQIGPAIGEPLLNIIPLREVTGEQLLAPNNTVIWGSDDEALSTEAFNRSAMFGYTSPGVGKIIFCFGTDERAKSENAFYFTNRLNVGDKFGLRWKGDATGTPDVMRARGAVSIFAGPVLEMGAGGDVNIPDLELMPETPDDDYYEVTDVTVHSNYNIDIISQGPAVEYTISVPEIKRSEWEKIILFNPTQVNEFHAPAGFMYNRMSMIYVLNYRLGPFFCDDPNMQQVSFNFVAERGLWVDDGRRQKAYGSVVNLTFDALTPGGIELIIELTPADENGVAIGPKEQFGLTYGIVMYGSSTKRDFIGNTFIVTPSFNGRFLVAVYRNTIAYWRTVSNSFYVPSGQEVNWAGTNDSVFGETILSPQRGQWEDNIKWTHCYSISTPKYYPFTDALTSLGDVTLVHAKTTQVKYAPQKDFEKNLNMIVTRSIPFWDGDSLGSNTPTTRGLDAAFHVMRTFHIGNVDDDNIDFNSVSEAFEDVFQAFGTVEATNFNHTFDSEQASFEDILTAIGESCFVTFYRQGNMIKAVADVSREDASLIFNHRNILQNTQSISFSFGTEEDYDGVEIEYSDNTDNQLKTYVAPFGIAVIRNPQKIRVAGVRTRVKAAMHAWRAANRLLYQNTLVEFDSCEEAALSIIKAKVLVADVTDADTQDGEIVRIDGLTVYTSQEINISPSQSYTLFIQNVDGTVQALPVVTDSTVHGLVLDGAPSGSLVIDADAGIYPKYVLVRNQNPLGTAYHIKEAQYKNVGVYSVLASNYTEGYYFNDAIRLWLTFNAYSGFPPIDRFFDRSPSGLDFEEVGSPSTVTDPDRENVYEGPNTTTYLVYPEFGGVTLQSYSIAFWIKLDVYNGAVFRSESSLNTLVLLANFGTSAFELLHDATLYASLTGVPTGEWNHIGITYDSETSIVRMYLNGEEESVALDVPGFDSFTGMRVFQIDGRGDDFRVYNKCKNPQFMRELYQKTINPPLGS